MKRVLLLILSAALLLTACSVPQNGYDFSMANVVNYTPTANTEPMNWIYDTIPSAQAQRADVPFENLVSVHVQREEEEFLAEDGTPYFRCQMETPSVFTQNNTTDEVINSQLESYMSRTLTEVAQWRQDTEYFYNTFYSGDSRETFYEWSSIGSVETMRLDENYISLVFFDSVYLGGAHPNNAQSALNFDVVTGGLLSLASIIDMESKWAVCDLLLSRLTEMRETFDLYDGFAGNVRQLFTGVPSEMAQHWYLTDQGIVFFFNPFEISPHSSGVVSVELTYRELARWLRADFAVPFSYGTGGELTTADKAPFKQSVEAVVLGEGDSLYLSAEENDIYDFKIYSLQKIEDGEFIPDHLLYAANRIAPQDVIEVILERDTDCPYLFCSYYTGTEKVERYISK